MGGDAPLEGASGEPPFDPGSARAVLVVDPDANIRSGACRALEDAGMVAVGAADGRTALRLIAADAVRPDVLLTTIELPAMSGIELAARILAMRPGVRVVMMTGDPNRAAAARDHRSIVATVLMQPLDRAELVSAVRPPRRNAAVR
jgi:DNA-binding NtrC family response regulator